MRLNLEVINMPGLAKGYHAERVYLRVIPLQGRTELRVRESLSRVLAELFNLCSKLELPLNTSVISTNK